MKGTRTYRDLITNLKKLLRIYLDTKILYRNAYMYVARCLCTYKLGNAIFRNSFDFLHAGNETYRNIYLYQLILI